MAIYTRKGDKGETGTFDGKRVSKSSKLVNTIGEIDELNSFLGVIGGFEAVQSDLFTVNAILAGSKINFSKSKITKLEKEIDSLEKTLPKQKSFIFYGGSPEAAKLFYARSICRRAERSLVSLHNSKFVIQDFIPAYINRLSDYLYIKGRESNLKAKLPEKSWRV